MERIENSQALDPVNGFNTILYQAIRGDIDPQQRIGLLLYLMANTDNSSLRHELLIEYLESIPDDRLHGDYLTGKLKIDECMDAICDNRDRWLYECSSESR